MEISVEAATLVNIFLFAFFFILFWIGYKEDDPKKRSAGAFLLVAGLLLFVIISVNYSSLPAFVWALMAAFGVFISLMGINKWFIRPNMPESDS